MLLCAIVITFRCEAIHSLDDADRLLACSHYTTRYPPETDLAPPKDANLDHCFDWVVSFVPAIPSHPMQAPCAARSETQACQHHIFLQLVVTINQGCGFSARG